MSYKPKHCCQCGEKIERIDWKPWTSRRFCQFCASEYGIYDWIPRVSGIGLALMILFISAYFQKPEKSVNILPNQLSSSIQSGRTPDNRNAAPPNTNAVQNAPTTAAHAALPKPSTAATKASDVKAKQLENVPVESAEKAVFCGAATKKGTSCSRRIKGGGRIAISSIVIVPATM